MWRVASAKGFAMTRLTRFFTQFSVFFTIAFLLWVSAEAVARFIVREIKWDAPPYMLAFTDDHIRKLYNTDNPAFYREVVLEGWGRSINLEYEPFVEFMPVAISGKHVNVAPEGFRIAPSGARKLNLPGNKVFVFGGSTAFGMGVSDGETIAAYLEQEFRASGRKDVAVFNFGVVGFFSTQERVLFERLVNLGQVPDAVVFIDGLNDFVYCRIPDATGMSNRIERVLSGQSGVTLLETYQRRSSILKVIRHYTEGANVARDKPNADCTGEEAQTQAIVRRLDSNRRMAAAVAKAHGVVAMFVQQPIPSYAYDNDRRPVPVRDIKSTPWQQTRRGYEIFRERRDKGNTFRENVLWLEEASIPENMYIDEVHYSPHFNRYIARQIYEALRERLKP
jgi:hypothetical protein